MGKDVIIACDFTTGKAYTGFSGPVQEEKPFVKIGMELFYAEGPDIVRELKARGTRSFLDLKLHDIPNTVKKAMRGLAQLEVDMVNLHAAGTIAMMEAALEGLATPRRQRPLLIAVTQLTSHERGADAEGPAHPRTLDETVLTTPEIPQRPGWTASSALRWRRA